MSRKRDRETDSSPEEHHISKKQRTEGEEKEKEKEEIAEIFDEKMILQEFEEGSDLLRKTVASNLADLERDLERVLQWALKNINEAQRSFGGTLSITTQHLATAFGELSKLSAAQEEVKGHDVAQKKIASDLKSRNSRVTLNVGGQRFDASKENLLRFENTYFSGLLGNDNWKPDADGSYFIDRDPTLFDVLLSYLRSGVLEPNGLSAFELKMLKSHFDYFLIPYPENFSFGGKNEIRKGFWLLSFYSDYSTRVSIKGNLIEMVENSKNYCKIRFDPNPISFRLKYIQAAEDSDDYKSPEIALEYLYIEKGVTRLVTIIFNDTGAHLYDEEADVEVYFYEVFLSKLSLKAGSLIDFRFNYEKDEVHLFVDGKDSGLYHQMKATRCSSVAPSLIMWRKGEVFEVLEDH